MCIVGKFIYLVDDCVTFMFRKVCLYKYVSVFYLRNKFKLMFVLCLIYIVNVVLSWI